MSSSVSGRRLYLCASNSAGKENAVWVCKEATGVTLGSRWRVERYRAMFHQFVQEGFQLLIHL